MVHRRRLHARDKLLSGAPTGAIAWRPRPVAALALLLPLLLSACQLLPGARQRQPGQAGASPTRPAVSLIAGPPVTVSGATARLPGVAEGRALFPVAAYGRAIVVAASPTDPSGPTVYELWDPASGSLSAIPGWQSTPGLDERVVGIAGDWALIARDSAPSSSSVSLLLRNVKSGEVRQIANDVSAGLRPRAAIADGWVAWVADSGGRPVLHAYALSTGSETVVQGRVGSLGALALGNGQVAWIQDSGPQAPRIVLRELPSGTFQAVPTGPATALALSSDGRSLVWLENPGGGNPGLFVRDLNRGTTERLIDGRGIGFSLSISGPYVAWQPRLGGGSATAGFYNLQTHELRLLQSAAVAAPSYAAVMGNWFVWSQGRRPALFGGAPVASATPPDVCCYAVPLGP